MALFRIGSHTDAEGKLWCCSSFKDGFHEAGKRGFSVLAGRDYFGNPGFAWQCRATDAEIIDFPVTSYPFSVISEGRIFYCPWCGRNLAKFYQKRIDELVRKGFSIGSL